MAEKRSDLDNLDRPDSAENGLSARSEPRHTSDGDLGLKAAKNDDLDAVDDQEMTAEAENLKGRIKETRDQMGETIDAIQDRLSFSNISGQVSDHVQNAVETAKDAVYDATIGKAAGFMKNVTNDISSTTVVRRARENPLPFILIGLGAGLLAYKSYAGKSTPRHRRHEFVGSQDLKLSSDSTIAGAARDKIDAITDKVSATAGNALDKFTVAFDDAYTGAGEVMDRATMKAHDLKETALHQYETHLDQHPLALGAAAVAFGAAVGMAIPSTRYEGQLFGETRNDLLDKAQNSAVGLLDRTKQAIVDVKPAIATQKASTIEH